MITCGGIQMSPSLRIGLASASTWLSILLVSCWCGEVAAFTVSCQSNASSVGDEVQEAKEDRKPSVVRLPKTNLAPVTAELTAPIGIASQIQPLFEKLENRSISLDVHEVPFADL